MVVVMVMGVVLVYGLWYWFLVVLLVFGLVLLVVSMVVLLWVLELCELLYMGNGCIVVGWLVVEDLVMVLVLVLMLVLGG